MPPSFVASVDGPLPHTAIYPAPPYTLQRMHMHMHMHRQENMFAALLNAPLAPMRV